MSTLRTKAEIGAAIEQHRKAKKLTRAAIAQKLGISESTVKNIEKGSGGNLPYETVLDIANALGVDAVVFLLKADYTGSTACSDPIVERAVRLLRSRSEVGVEKYQTTLYALANKGLSKLAKIDDGVLALFQHSIEEKADDLLYTLALLARLERINKVADADALLRAV